MRSPSSTPAPPSTLSEQPALYAAAPTAREPSWEELEIVPHFEPIVDLRGPSLLGYEVVSRSPRFERISDAFLLAEERGHSWELELVCRERAVAHLARLSGSARGARFFLNVGPAVLADPRFLVSFTKAVMADRGIDAARIVLEVTEQQAVADYERFAALIRHYVAEGFRISLGDFGSGYSSLMKLVNCAPEFVKLDRDLVRGVQHDLYRQRMIRSLVDFATNLDATLIAEGVEQWEELDVLLQLGVEFAQGPLFAPTDAEPRSLSADLLSSVEPLVRRHRAVVGLPDASGAFARPGRTARK